MLKLGNPLNGIKVSLDLVTLLIPYVMSVYPMYILTYLEMMTFAIQRNTEKLGLLLDSATCLRFACLIYGCHCIGLCKD